MLLQLSHDNILQFLGVDKRGEGLQVQNHHHHHYQHHHYQHHHYQHHHYDGSGGILSTTWISKIYLILSYLILSQVEFWLVTSFHEHGSLCDFLKNNVLTVQVGKIIINCPGW